MKTQAPPQPSPALPLEQARLPLDERIRLAEQRLISREQRLQSAARQWGQHIRAAARPSRLLLPLLALAAAAVAVGWLWKRGRPRPMAHAVGQRTPPHSAHQPASPVAWASLLALAMPLLPARWRLKGNPRSASTWLALGIPLLQRWWVGEATAPLTLAPAFDVNRYIGTWYEVAHLNASLQRGCDSQPMIRYALRGDGQLDVLHRCRQRNGHWRTTQGIARPTPVAPAAQWHISLWPRWLHRLPLAWTDYRILDVDEDYKTALVGTRDRRGLWLLSRRPHIPAQRLQAMLERARRDGFAVERLRFNV